MMRFFSMLLCFVSMGASGSFAQSSGDIGFTPHKALYEVDLVRVRGGSPLNNISGNMYYEWGRSCDAWVSKYKFDIGYDYSGAPVMRMVSDMLNVEAFDGSTLDFDIQRKRDGDLYEEIRGHAMAVSDDTDARVLYDLPADEAMDLPDDASFPMAHTLKVLAAIRAGEKFYNAVVFDGTDLRGAAEINAFIGAAVTFDDNTDYPQSVDVDLLKGDANLVQLAFYPLVEGGENPEYEMSVVFHHNGVMRGMEIRYDDFTMRQRLIALEAMPRENVSKECE